MAALPTFAAPSPLAEVEARVRETAKAGKTPIVVFDLDDTLVDSAPRKHLALLEAASDPDLERRFPSESRSVRALSLAQTRGIYSAGRMLEANGIGGGEFRKALTAAWLRIFLSGRYLPFDPPIPGAVEYVRRLYGAGATVAYVSGRDDASMGSGTRDSLGRLGLPIEEGAVLLLKPDAREGEGAFKRRALDELAAKSEVVAGFDNEPANINAFKDRFPSALAVFLATQRSDRPAKPYSGLPQVTGYLE